MALPVSYRIKKKKDFDMVFKKGKATSGSFLFIKTISTNRAHARFGFVVAAKFAPKAVTRNKIRRLFSDTVGTELLLNMPTCDTVVVVTKKVPHDTTDIRTDFLTTLRRAHLL